MQKRVGKVTLYALMGKFIKLFSTTECILRLHPLKIIILKTSIFQVCQESAPGTVGGFAYPLALPDTLSTGFDMITNNLQFKYNGDNLNGR